MSTETTRIEPAPLRPASAVATAALAAAMSALAVARLGLSPWTVVVAAAVAALVWVAAIDLESRLLPDRIVLPATAAVLVCCAILEPGAFPEHAVASVAAGGAMLLAVALRPGGLGMGDAKLALLLGALLGRTVFEALVLGFSLFALVGIALVLRDGRGALKRQLPLGPALAAGAILALLLGG